MTNPTGLFVECARQIVRGLTCIVPRYQKSARSAAPALNQGLDVWYTYANKRLEWRHHGLGMLQAEFSDTLRIHIWHPTLVSPGMTWPRCVHDHRFDIQSAVIVGTIRDVVPDVREDKMNHMSAFKAWQKAKVYEIEHAKNQDRLILENGCSTATCAKFLGDVILTRFYANTRYQAGTTYEIKRRVFHTTEVDDLAITIVHRSNFDDKLARVLCSPEDNVTAISGIVRDESIDHQLLVNQVLYEATKAIQKEFHT